MDPLNQAQVNQVLSEDAAKDRVPIHTFNPDASPQEKAAAIGESRSKLESVVKDSKPNERGIAVDTGKAKVVPTISIQDMDTDEKPPVNGSAVNSTESARPASAAPPGSLTENPAPAIPDWYKVGWRSVSGIDAPVPEGQEKDKAILERFLSEQFYGDWYHNAALIFFVTFASHLMTRFHAGIGWLIVLLAFANTYYSMSMQRVRRRARDDIQRELVKTHLDAEHESAEWMNNFLSRFWLIYEPILSQTVVSSVDQILSANTPPFLDSIRLSTFTLGTKAPRIDQIRTILKTAEDVIEMEWGLSFTPNDISDMTPRQVALKVNPKVVLSIRLGTGLATAAMPVLLEDITFSAVMKIRLKLMTNFPHVQTASMSFMAPPHIDYVLKPIGGETFGFDINHIPGLSQFISSLTDATLGPMMYWPNVFTLNLEELLSGAPLDAAIGVLQVTVASARGIKATKISGGVPDPFVSISINNRAELAKTKYKHNTYNPSWMETKFILVNNLTETLIFDLYDFNDHLKNTHLGAASFELSELVEDASREGVKKPVLKDGKDKGEMRFDVSFYPVLKPKSGESAEIMEETTAGIVRLTVHQAKELDTSKSLSGDLNPFAKVYVGGGSAPIHSTSRFKHTINPVWESAAEFLCSDRASSVITIKVGDDRDFMRDLVVGYISIRLEDLLEAKKEAGKDWWPLSGCKSGKIRLSVEWKPLNIAGSLHGVSHYAPPIGVVRVHLQKAVNVKNVEAALGGKSDPYVRVQLNNVTKCRTQVINNNLNPVWDEILYVPVHSLRETLMLECMDYQNLTKDRSLGSVELHVSSLAKASNDHEKPYESLGKKPMEQPMRLDGGDAHKGQLVYVAEFVAAIPVKLDKFAKAADGLVRSPASTLDDAGSMVSHVSTEEGAAPEVTARRPLGSERRHVKGSTSVDTTATANTVNSTQTAETGGTSGEEKADTKGSAAGPRTFEGMEMSKEELLQQQSGIIIFNALSGQLHKRARLQVLLDDGYWPVFSTVKARSKHAQWEHVGEGFVKELDFGRVWLRLNENEGEEKEDIIAEWQGDAKQFLSDTLDGPFTVTFPSSDGDDQLSVTIETRYVPVPVQLEEREMVTNQGALHVELINGRDIPAADRGGKSDPYALFTLNGHKVYKSQTKKKTLNPDWDESFDVEVPSRAAAEFSVEVLDWNQIEQAKSLGTAHIDLSKLEPFQSSEQSLQLTSARFGSKSTVNVRLLFHPQILTKVRKNTSATFAATRTMTQTMTQLGGLPVTAGKGVLHGVTGVFKKEKDFAKMPDGQDSAPVVGSTNGQTLQQTIGPSDSVGKAAGAVFPSIANENGNGKAKSVGGALRLTVLDGKDLTPDHHDVKPYVTLRLGDKEVKTKPAGKTDSPEWKESFSFVAGPLTPKLYIWVHDHKTLGKDKVLTEGELEIWNHIQPDKTSTVEVLVQLQQGIVRLRLEFDADPNPILVRGSSQLSFDRNSTIGSPMRFSIRGKKSIDAGKGGN